MQQHPHQQQPAAAASAPQDFDLLSSFAGDPFLESQWQEELLEGGLQQLRVSWHHAGCTNNALVLLVAACIHRMRHQPEWLDPHAA
jgi:hypothetical protein